ncbi:MAG TPA: CAP domain-containing protein, partial [Chloroflexota bacterium]|nr:CAP domain-containing protein [Chloroflexota bacterium]
ANLEHFTLNQQYPKHCRFAIVKMRPLRLYSAFVNGYDRAVLRGLSPLMSTPGSQTLRGRARTSLNQNVFVTEPNGSVDQYPLATRRRRFSATVPFPTAGEYQVEVVAASGQDVFNVSVFVDTHTFVPMGLRFPRDPRAASQKALDAFSVRLLNRFRRQEHLSRFSLDSNLSKAAQRHNWDMVRFGYYYAHPHIGSDGSTPPQRLAQFGVACTSWAEVEGDGASVGNLVDRWLLSPVHRLILQGSESRVGVGVNRAAGGWLMTVDLCAGESLTSHHHHHHRPTHH